MVFLCGRLGLAFAAARTHSGHSLIWRLWRQASKCTNLQKASKGYLRHFIILYILLMCCEIITSRRKTPCTTRSCFAFRDPARRQVCQHCACVAFQGLMAWPWALLTECCVIELSTSVHLTSPVCFCCTSAYQSIWSVTCQCWQLCFRHPFPNR